MRNEDCHGSSSRLISPISVRIPNLPATGLRGITTDMTHYYGGLVGPVCRPFRIARSRNRPEMYEILTWQECLMKLRHNEYCPNPQIAPLLRPRTNPSRAACSPAFDEWRPPITQGDTGNFDRPRKCANS